MRHSSRRPAAGCVRYVTALLLQQAAPGGLLAVTAAAALAAAAVHSEVDHRIHLLRALLLPASTLCIGIIYEGLGASNRDPAVTA